MQVVQRTANNNFNLIMNINETSTNIAANTSQVDWSLQLQSIGGSFAQWGITPRVDINGVNEYNKGGQFTCNNGQTITLASGTVTITHNDDGTKTVPFSCSITQSSSPAFTPGNTSLSDSLTLTTIPRYANVTNRLSSVSETSIVVSWSADAICDYVWYSLDGGAWIAVGEVNASSGSYTISNVSSNNYHTFKTLVRRKDSQLQRESTTASATTYDFPHCTSAPNFTIGDSVRLGFYNPLRRKISVTIISNKDSSTIYTSSTTSDYLDCLNSNSAITNLYKSIPNNTSSTYKVKVSYSTSNRESQGGTYSINPSINTPTCGDFTYKDINDVTTKLTGNNQVLVDGYSKCEITTEKATAKNYATMSSYDLYWGQTINVKTDDTIIGTIDKGSGSIVRVTAIDSRGLNSYISKDITNIKYVDPFISSVATERKNGVDVETFLSATFKLWNGNWNEENKNQLMYFAYHVKISDDEWSDYFDITEQVKSLAQVTEQNNIQTYTIDFNDNLAIHANGSSGGFEIGKQYTIEIMVRDGNGIVTNTLVSANSSAIVTDGKIGLSRYKDSNGDYHYGIGKMPNDEVGLDVAGGFAINGVIMPEIEIIEEWDEPD